MVYLFTQKNWATLSNILPLSNISKHRHFDGTKAIVASDFEPQQSEPTVFWIDQSFQCIFMNHPCLQSTALATKLVQLFPCASIIFYFERFNTQQINILKSCGAHFQIQTPLDSMAALLQMFEYANRIAKLHREQLYLDQQLEDTRKTQISLKTNLETLDQKILITESRIAQIHQYQQAHFISQQKLSSILFHAQSDQELEQKLNHDFLPFLKNLFGTFNFGPLIKDIDHTKIAAEKNYHPEAAYIFPIDVTPPTYLFLFASTNFSDRNSQHFRRTNIFVKPYLELVKQQTINIRNKQVRNVLAKNWATTFDHAAIPVLVTNLKNVIIQNNRPFENLIKGKIVNNHFNIKEYGSFLEDQKFQFNSTGEIYRYHYHESVDHDLKIHTFVNVTNIDRMIHQIKLSQNLAQIGIMAGSIAHEINNPLAGILAFIQLMLLEPNLPEDLKADLQEMEAAVFKSKRIVESLLLVSRKSGTSKQEINIKELLQKVLGIIELRALSDQIKIQFNKQENWPDIKCLGNSNHLLHLFLNLLNYSCDSLISSRIYLEKKISIEVMRNNSEQLEIKILDNRYQPEENLLSDMPIIVAKNIIREHNGNIVIRHLDRNTQTVVSMPALP